MQNFINQHKDCDLRSLAFKKMPEGVDASWVLRQIEGYQLAKKKLPLWADTEGLIYPPRISMEQCSSETTAEYKAQILQRLFQGKKGDIQDNGCDDIQGKKGHTLIDLTGGFGVDFSYMARQAQHAIYVEQQEVLCEAARHNMPLLGLENAVIVNANCNDFLASCHEAGPQFSILNSQFEIFLDPARRNEAGKKVFTIDDCTPNLNELLPVINEKIAPEHIIIKLSPMLDITQALRSLPNVSEIHVISVKGECKELLFVLSKGNADNKEQPNFNGETNSIAIHCVNLNTSDAPFIFNKSVENEDFALSSDGHCEDFALPSNGHCRILSAPPHAGMYLMEPNASILKAGVQDAMANSYGFKKLATNSNLYCLEAEAHTNNLHEIPGRLFIIEGISDFNKGNLRSFLKDIKQANLTIRNFPSSVAELRKRLKIKEGGNEYLFATTLYDGSHALIRGNRPSPPLP